MRAGIWAALSQDSMRGFSGLFGRGVFPDFIVITDGYKDTPGGHWHRCCSGLSLIRSCLIYWEERLQGYE